MAARMERSIAVVAAGTGEGKTSVALGLAAALQACGHRVAPFKFGPDYIDAALYERVTGSRAQNVDLWLDGPQRAQALVRAAQSRGEIVLVEGMMGLFDGDDEGKTSTAHLLSLLDIPAFIVIDGWRMSQTGAAVVAGLQAFEPRVRVAGVILNRCGGETHRRSVEAALARIGVPLVAAIPYDPQCALPERHLGLDPHARDAGAVAQRIAPYLAQACTFDVLPAACRDDVSPDGPVIAYAQDDAFWFTYPLTLEALRAAGAHPVPFSPLRDSALPLGTRGIWLGGGYPEAHAAQLAANASMRAGVRQAAADGVPVYGECGGLMYLGDTLQTPEGIFAMCGVLRVQSSIHQPRLRIGYQELEAAADSVLDRKGERVRAYEFHYAQALSHEPPAYAAQGDGGALRANVLASFFHRRFHPGDSAVCRFVDFCLQQP